MWGNCCWMGRWRRSWSDIVTQACFKCKLIHGTLGSHHCDSLISTINYKDYFSLVVDESMKVLNVVNLPVDVHLLLGAGMRRGKLGGTWSSTSTCENGREAICSISTNNLWRLRLKQNVTNKRSRVYRLVSLFENSKIVRYLRYMSYFCLIFHRIAAIISRDIKQAENVMKNCCNSNLGCWLNETYGET